MTPAAFLTALASTQMHPEGSTTRAARLVLVDGIPPAEAARRVGVHRAAVSRALARLRAVDPCPHCGGTGRASNPPDPLEQPA